MTPLHADIIRTIEQHGPITSEDIAERLTALGYGGGTCFDEFKRQVSKIASKLKASGKVIGDDIPIPGARPMRVYRMVETEEMASDVAEVETVTEKCSATIQESLTVADENLTVAEAVTHKPPMSVQDALAGKPQWMSGNDFSNFLLGIEFAEKYHGISQ